MTVFRYSDPTSCQTLHLCPTVRDLCTIVMNLFAIDIVAAPLLAGASLP